MKDFVDYFKILHNKENPQKVAQKILSKNYSQEIQLKMTLSLSYYIKGGTNVFRAIYSERMEQVHEDKLKGYEEMLNKFEQQFKKGRSF